MLAASQMLCRANCSKARKPGSMMELDVAVCKQPTAQHWHHGLLLPGEETDMQPALQGRPGPNVQC